MHELLTLPSLTLIALGEAAVGTLDNIWNQQIVSYADPWDSLSRYISDFK